MKNEILPGVHGPNLPSSGSGDHCRGTHEASEQPVLQRAVQRHLLRGKAQRASAFALLLPQKPVVPQSDITLLWLYCREPTSASLLVPTRVPTNCARPQAPDMAQLVPVMQQGSENKSTSHSHRSNFFAIMFCGEPGKYRSVPLAKQWSFSGALHLLSVLAIVLAHLSNILAPHLTLCNQPAFLVSRGVSKLHSGSCQSWGGTRAGGAEEGVEPRVEHLKRPAEPLGLSLRRISPDQNELP